MRTNTFAARVVGLALGGAGLLWLIGLGGGTAAAGTQCVASGGTQVERIDGASGCGAQAGPGSRATAEDFSTGGTAVAVAERGGNANAFNLQPGSTTLAGANTGGNAYAISTGPKAFSLAQATQGGTTLAIGGWGGAAIGGPAGVSCSGGFAAAVNTSSGKACLHSGSIDLQN